MATMSRYCKAYPIEHLQQFAGWPAERAEAPADVLDDDVPYLFVHDNYAVTRNIFMDEQLVYDGSDPEWITFCRTVLAFSPENEA